MIALGLLLIWNEARQARIRATLAEQVLNADPLTLDSLKRRMIDKGIDRVIDLVIPSPKGL